ncbi:GNAT family N-acetyltransferase [Sphaerobacter thermophilus]|uniref:GNAT family N-acetyltransferase n=1 Tax=Sphaerobacter thermophilus TaxID=2057 RepID=UPI000DB20D79|nr:MAG: GNAT family N-acetyltransferase [Sphaerobacter thermophilus]
MAVVREFEPADLDGVKELRARAFWHATPERLERDASIWRWLETHPLAAEHLHRWVLVDGDRIVGFLGAIPQYYRIAGRRVVAHAPGEYMVDSNYGFHAVLLMRAFFRTVENCVTCDWHPEVLRVQGWLGATDVVDLEAFTKPLTTAKLPVSLPRPVGAVVNLGLRVVDSILTTGRDRFEIKVLDDFDDRFDRFFEAVSSQVPCIPEKDVAFLRWRYGESSPHTASAILAALDGDDLLGYAVLRVTPTDRAGLMPDVTVLPGRHDVARELVRAAARYFRRAGATVIWYRFLASPVGPRPSDVRRLGFIPRKRRPRLQVKFADPELHQMAVNAANWAFSYGDEEVGFWDE